MDTISAQRPALHRIILETSEYRGDMLDGSVGPELAGLATDPWGSCAGIRPYETRQEISAVIKSMMPDQLVAGSGQPRGKSEPASLIGFRRSALPQEHRPYRKHSLLAKDRPQSR